MRRHLFGRLKAHFPLQNQRIRPHFSSRKCRSRHSASIGALRAPKSGLLGDRIFKWRHAQRGGTGNEFLAQPSPGSVPATPQRARSPRNHIRRSGAALSPPHSDIGFVLSRAFRARVPNFVALVFASRRPPRPTSFQRAISSAQPRRRASRRSRSSRKGRRHHQLSVADPTTVVAWMRYCIAKPHRHAAPDLRTDDHCCDSSS